MLSKEESIAGSILGTAVGDAIGLPMEGLSKQRLKRLFPKLGNHSFFFGRGMTSDDTEHTCMIAQALIESGGPESEFSGSLSRRFRLWLLYLPADIGLATLKAILRLWLGSKPQRSGVFSAGNGPAMRSAIIGVTYGDDRQKMVELVKTSTKITHSDPKAEHGAQAVALAAYIASTSDAVEHADYLSELTHILVDEPTDFLGLVRKAADSVKSGETTEEFAQSIGCSSGVSGYVYQTVPIVLHSWFRHQRDIRSAILDVVSCGGDTDTTAAIVGGIVGASVGSSGIPKEWLEGILEWPRSVQWMERLAVKLTKSVDEGRSQPVSPFLPTNLLRNLLFLIVVLWHGFRRLLPPY